MTHQASAAVARQATFDTDPDRAKIKRGTLKLPVIQGENEKLPTNDIKQKAAVKRTAEIKSGQINSAENSQTVSSKHKEEKDNVDNHRKSDATSDTKEASVSEKQKKLNALNDARSQKDGKPKETDDSKKEPTQRASVLNNLNSKRNKSPDTRHSRPKLTENSADNSGIKSKQTDNQAHAIKTDVTSNKSKKLTEKTDKSPPKEKDKDKNQSVTDNKLQLTKDRKDLNETKSAERRGRSPIKKSSANSTQDNTTKKNPNKQTEVINDTSKVVKKESNLVKREKSPKKPISPKETDSHITLKEKKQSGDSAQTSVTLHEKERTKKTKREKGTENPKDDSNKVAKEISDPKSKQSKESIHQPDINILDKQPKSKQSKESTHQPGINILDKESKPKQSKEIIHQSDEKEPNSKQSKESIHPNDINILDKIPTTPEKDTLFSSNKAPAETKLNYIKHLSKEHKTDFPDKNTVSDSDLLNDIPDETEHDDLTTAVAKLVSEGSKHSSDTVNQSQENSEVSKSNRIQTPDNLSNTEDKPSDITELNETKDNVFELKGSKGQKLDNTAENRTDTSKVTVRQTYVVSPSPTKVDSSEINIPELLVEQIGIESRQKGRKMQGKESYEQVYAERNTLLNAEYTYRKRIKQLEDEANGFLRAIEDLTSENRLLRDRVDHLESKQRHNGDDSAYDKISELEKEKGQLEGRVKQLEHLANSNANANNSTDTMQKEIRELKAQVIKLQTDNQNVNEENIKLKAENYENVKKLHAVEAEKGSLAKSVTAVESEKTDKIQDLKNEHARSKKDNSDIKSKNEELQKRVNTLEYENNSLSETLSEKKNELKEIMAVMKDENKFENEIKDLKNQILKLQQEKKETETKHSKELRTKIDELQETKARLDDTSKEIYELKIKFDTTEKENKSLNEDNVNLKKIKQSQEKEIEKLKAEIDRLKQALRDSNEKYDHVVNDTKSASLDLRTAKETAEELNRDLQKIVADKEAQISKLISQLEASNKNKDFETQTLKKEKEQLSNENNRLKVFEANMGRMEGELKQIVSKYEEAELKHKQLNIQLQDKGFEISNLEQQVFEQNMKLDNCSRRIGQLDKEKRELEEDRREWEVKKEKVNDIEASNRRLIEENKRLRSQLEVTSFSLDYKKPPEPEKERPVVEAWVTDTSSKPSQQALYVQREKKKVTIDPHPTMSVKKPFTKSKPTRSVKSVSIKKEDPRNNVRSSRSLEDLRRTPDQRTPDSEASLPELQRETRLTTYASFGQTGYAQIHKNRIRSLHKKVY